jgi:hypothetical protein
MGACSGAADEAEGNHRESLPDCSKSRASSRLAVSKPRRQIPRGRLQPEFGRRRSIYRLQFAGHNQYRNGSLPLESSCGDHVSRQVVHCKIRSCLLRRRMPSRSNSASDMWRTSSLSMQLRSRTLIVNHPSEMGANPLRYLIFPNSPPESSGSMCRWRPALTAASTEWCSDGRSTRRY